MRDRIHQPYRAKLIPGLEEILELQVEGLLGVALSGAGPTVFAFVEPEFAKTVGESDRRNLQGARRGGNSAAYRN